MFAGPKQVNIRYGRNYKVVLAIVLPCLLIWPFILLMQQFKSLEEWQVWVIIYAFLGVIISLTLWLVLNVYPKATLSFYRDEISLTFKPGIFPGPSGFSFFLPDIISLTLHQIGGDGYYVFETRNPKRKFQVSPVSRSLEELTSFNEMMEEIREKINRQNF